jgi:hypothetical protein
MRSPPAARPETQEARGANRGRTPNPNYVRIANPIAARRVKLKLARRWVQEGRAEWVAKGSEIRLVESHPEFRAYAVGKKARVAATDSGYDETRDFEWWSGQSGGCVVRMPRPLRAPSLLGGDGT